MRKWSSVLFFLRGGQGWRSGDNQLEIAPYARDYLTGAMQRDESLQSGLTAAGFSMHLCVAFGAQRYQVLFHIPTRMAAGRGLLQRTLFMKPSGSPRRGRPPVVARAGRCNSEKWTATRIQVNILSH